MIHDLKIEPNYLQNILDGNKKVEIRYNDRNYKKGDLLRFKNYAKQEIEEVLCEITHIHSGLGMKEGYVALSIINLSDS